MLNAEWKFAMNDETQALGSRLEPSPLSRQDEPERGPLKRLAFVFGTAIVIWMMTAWGGYLLWNL